MPSDLGRLAAATLALSLVSGCAGSGGELSSAFGADPSWGEANRQTFAAQIIDPAPHYDTAVPATEGQKAAAAIERLRTDKVKQPDKQMTSRLAN